MELNLSGPFVNGPILIEICMIADIRKTNGPKGYFMLWRCFMIFYFVSELFGLIKPLTYVLMFCPCFLGFLTIG